MPRPAINIIGQRFTRLFAREEGPLKILPCGQSRRTTICDCDCGEVVTVLNNSLRSGGTKSCGCYNRDTQHMKARRHGYSGTSIYSLWRTMVARCDNPNASNFNRYGGSGITVCDRWHSFENFLADMGERPEGTQIDRWPNPNGNYEKSNCRWATLKQQHRNKRSNRIITVRGITGCLIDLCERFGVPYKLIVLRLWQGWTSEDAFFRPLQRKTERRIVQK